MDFSPLVVLSPLAVLLSAVIGAAVALHSIKHQREIARKRATLDLISQREWEPEAIKIRDEFVKIRDTAGGLQPWAEKPFRDTPQLATIVAVLNEYELIAVGIREGILDEELYNRWYKSSYLSHWESLRGFIHRIRETEERYKLFIEFENLAYHWGGTPIDPEQLRQRPETLRVRTRRTLLRLIGRDPLTGAQPTENNL